MAFQHGKDTVVVGADVALTGDLTSAVASKSLQAPNVTTFGNDDKQFLGGLTEGTLQLDGVFDNATDGLDEELDAALSSSVTVVMTVGYGGLAVGDRTSMLEVRESSYNVRAATTDAVRMTGSFVGTGAVLGGVSLHDLTAETATGNDTSHDNSSSTANGGVGHLHVTAASGTSPTLDVKIQHSSDNSTWVDLITFTQATARTSERKSATGTVNRYVRAEWTVGGTSPSFTFAVAFGRLLR